MTREEFLVRRSIAVKLPPGAAKGSEPIHKGIGRRRTHHGKVAWAVCAAAAQFVGTEASRETNRERHYFRAKLKHP